MSRSLCIFFAYSPIPEIDGLNPYDTQIKSLNNMTYLLLAILFWIQPWRSPGSSRVDNLKMFACTAFEGCVGSEAHLQLQGVQIAYRWGRSSLVLSRG